MKIEYSDFLPIWKDFIKDAESVLNVQMVAHHFYNLGLSASQTKPLDDLFYYNQGFNDCLAKMVDAKSFDEDEFNHIAYNYRSWPAHDPKGVSERYQELVDHVKSITAPRELSDEEIMDQWKKAHKIGGTK